MFRAVWPIRDESIPLCDLIAEAEAELPTVAGRACCRLTGPGRWVVARSEHVPGSGRVTPRVLMLEAPAMALPVRAYHMGCAG